MAVIFSFCNLILISAIFPACIPLTLNGNTKETVLVLEGFMPDFILGFASVALPVATSVWEAPPNVAT